MAHVKFGELTANTNGELPPIGAVAPDFILTGNNMKDISLSQFAGSNLILNIFPSLDTSTCATSVREFNKRAATLTGNVVLCISRDLPFAMRRFCGAEGIDNVITASDFRGRFARPYGVEFVDGKFTGLTARAVVVIDKPGKGKYTELVPAIGQEPNYDAALELVRINAGNTFCLQSSSLRQICTAPDNR